MKRKENMKKTEDRRLKIGAGNRGQGAKCRVHVEKKQEPENGIQEVTGNLTTSRNPESENRNPEPATKENSTVYQNKSQSQKDSRESGKNREGNEVVRLAPVIINFSREELAITACELLRVFNN